MKVTNSSNRALVVQGASGVHVQHAAVRGGNRQSRGFFKGLVAVAGAAGVLGVWSRADAALQLYVGVRGGGVSMFDAGSGLPTASAEAATPYGVAVSGTTLYATSSAGTVETFNAITGAVKNSTFISGSNVSTPQGLAVYGNTLFVTNVGSYYDTTSGSIGTFDATTGAVKNASFITGLWGEESNVAISSDGSTLYLADDRYQGGTKVEEFNASTGALINANFITGLSGPWGVAVSGNSLYVSSWATGTVGKYDATTGLPIGANGASFITGLRYASSLAVYGNTIYVDEYASNTVGEFDATTGLPVNSANWPGIRPGGDVLGLAVADTSVPEPSGLGLLAAAGVTLLRCRRRAQA